MCLLIWWRQHHKYRARRILKRVKRAGDTGCAG
nr:MAG TPA: hypothetical protein [Caudoviricetes sp.]